MVVGLGDMGLPIAMNLVKAKHEVYGADLRNERVEMLVKSGGHKVEEITTTASEVDCVFLMVMHGKQVHELVLGENGLLTTLKKGSCIIVTATIRPNEFDQLIEPCEKAGIGLIDSPVSGGRAGAEAGSLTLMASGKKEDLVSQAVVLDAISGKKFIVGNVPGLGMRAKTSLQTMIGTCFAAVFEGLALSAKAGVDGKAMFEIISNSAISSPMVNYCSEQILNRKFTDTGSQMTTIYKDIGIALDYGREQGVPLFTTSAAFQLFQAAMSAYPGEDNWAGIKVIEDITGAKAQF